MAACLLVATAIALGGCAAGTGTSATRGRQPDPKATDYITADKARVEYAAASARLTLGPGWSWPATPEPSTGPDGAPQFYQVHAATNDAQTMWFCSWVDAYASAGSAAQRNLAATSLRRLPTLYLYRSGASAAARSQFDAVLSNVAHAKTAAVREFDAQNCIPLKH